jgi:hypothetical protein
MYGGNKIQNQMRNQTQNENINTRPCMNEFKNS